MCSLAWGHSKLGSSSLRLDPSQKHQIWRSNAPGAPRRHQRVTYKLGRLRASVIGVWAGLKESSAPALRSLMSALRIQSPLALSVPQGGQAHCRTFQARRVCNVVEQLESIHERLNPHETNRYSIYQTIFGPFSASKLPKIYTVKSACSQNNPIEERNLHCEHDMQAHVSGVEASQRSSIVCTEERMCILARQTLFNTVLLCRLDSQVD